jgi:hypothetical protein
MLPGQIATIDSPPSALPSPLPADSRSVRDLSILARWTQIARPGPSDHSRAPVQPQAEKSYVSWVRRFVIYHDRRHGRDLGAEHVEGFLSWLASERKVSASTQNQALCALLFLYREVLGSNLDWIDGITPRAGRRGCPSRRPGGQEPPGPLAQPRREERSLQCLSNYTSGSREIASLQESNRQRNGRRFDAYRGSEV